MVTNNNQMLELKRNQMLQELSKSLIKFAKSELFILENQLEPNSVLHRIFALEDYISDFKLDPTVVDLQNEELLQKVVVLMKKIWFAKKVIALQTKRYLRKLGYLFVHTNQKRSKPKTIPFSRVPTNYD